jgi:hypothetical protein
VVRRIRNYGGRRAVVGVLVGLVFGSAGILALVRDSAESSISRPKPSSTVTGTTGIAAAAPVANFKRLSLGNPDEAPVLNGREFDALPRRWQQQQDQLEQVRAADSAAAPPAPSAGSASTDTPSPAAGLTFNAVDDNNAFIPPDTAGAPGLDKLMVTVNGTVQVQRKTDGGVLSSMGLDTFFSLVSGVDKAFDPHVLYDPFADRWIVAAVSNPASSSADLLLAVSKTSDPLGDWNEYRVFVDAGGTTWGDYPTVGFNKNWMVVSLNMFANTGKPPECGSIEFCGTQTYGFDKAKAYAGPAAGGGAYQLFSRPYPPYEDFTLAPTAVYDPDTTDMYLAEDYDGTGIYSDLPLRLFKLSGPIGSATLTQLPDPVGSPLAALGNWRDVTSGGVGFAPQLGSTQNIDNGDSRLSQCIYRNGSVWCANTVFLPYLPSSPPVRSTVQWYEIDPTPSTPVVLRAGRIGDGATQFSAFPSIAVNKFNDALIGFSRFSSNDYPGAAYAYRNCSDAPNTFRDQVQYQAGAGPYFKTYSGDRNRWGDYSGTWVDPSDDASIWTIQEYAKLFTGAPTANAAGTWGAWWGKVGGQTHAAPAAPSPTSSDHTNAASSNPIVNVTWPADDCAISYLYKWSTSPSDVPEPATDGRLSGNVSSLASPPLAAGSSWWLHLEAVNGAGTGSPVAHLGPFPITSPSPPPPLGGRLPPSPVTCIVPRVTGLTIATARAALTSANCALGTSSTAFSSTVASGRVVSQSPAPGAERSNGAPVNIVISKGRAPKKPPPKVTLCYRHHSVKVTEARAKVLRKHGAKHGACKTVKKRR